MSLKQALERTFKAGATLPPSAEASDGDRRPVAHTGPEDPPVAAAPVEEAALTVEHPQDAMDAQDMEPFSALELRDRVVIMLLFDQVITEEQVAQVWSLWQQEYRRDVKTPLWRLLTLIPDLDRELILAAAAQVFSIEEAHIAVRAVTPVIKKLAAHAPPPLWEKMVELRLIPVAEAEQKLQHRMHLVFASHDPTHPEVKDLLAHLGVDVYELRYMPEYEIVALLAEAFPDDYTALQEILAEERAYFEKAAEEEALRQEEAALLVPETEEPEAASQAAPVNTASIISFFEEMLVEVVRSGASGVCLVPNMNGKSEVYTLVDEALTPWCLIEHIPPELLFSTLKSAIIRADLSLDEGNRKQIIDRWIDGRLVHFRVLALPSGAMLDREAIVFRVLT